MKNKGLITVNELITVKNDWTLSLDSMLAIWNKLSMKIKLKGTLLLTHMYTIIKLSPTDMIRQD